MARPRTPLHDRFWAKVDKTGASGCWLWTGSRMANGYGSITEGGQGGRVLLAHRVAWLLTHGPIPQGLSVVHPHKSCPRICVRPDHLALHTKGWRRERSSAEVVDAFWVRVHKSSGCWIWTGATDVKGYGRCTDSHGVAWLAHRFAWTVEVGPIPEGLWVLHHCDNPSCVRTDHLYIGTAADNTRDMFSRGRARPGAPKRGEEHRWAKLTEADVRAIRAKRPRTTLVALANEYDVSKGTINFIVQDKTWRHVK